MTEPTRDELADRYAIAHKIDAMQVLSVCAGVHTTAPAKTMLCDNDHSHGRDTSNARWQPQECVASVEREPAGKCFLHHLQDSEETS